MTLRLLIIALTFLPAFACAKDSKINDLSHEELKSLMLDLVERNIEQHKISLRVSNKFTTEAVLAGTRKGNGTLAIGTQLFRVYDEHDDGFIYQGGLLGVSFVDINSDGSNDIVFHGIGVETSEKGDVVSSKALTYIYLFRPESGGFTKVYSNSNYEVQLRP